ncbi:MAG: hypothetical protein DRJ03_17590 [Chloroflexi bacterium]|nr:MAG: hypothetical protein DRJ03_17590 [Chloroflexota bacterium]
MRIEDVEGFDSFSDKYSLELYPHDVMVDIVNEFKSHVRCGFELEGNSTLPYELTCPRCGNKVTVHEYDQLHHIINYLIHNGKSSWYKQAMKIYWDGSVDTELVTTPLKVDEIEMGLTFFTGLLRFMGVDLRPTTRAGGHQTISVGARLPDVVLANIEQLSRRFAPTLVRVGCSPYDTYRRSERFRYLNQSPIYNYPLDGWEEKYRFVHFKNYTKATGIEFRYPDALPPKYNYVSAILNMALVWKAMKITLRHGKVIAWENELIRKRRHAYELMICESIDEDGDYMASNDHWVYSHNTHDDLVDTEVSKWLSGHWWYYREDDEALFKLLKSEIKALTEQPFDEWFRYVYNYHGMLDYNTIDFDIDELFECEHQPTIEDGDPEFTIDVEVPRNIRIIRRVL